MLESLLVISESKADVLADGGRENEWLLFNVSNFAFDFVLSSRLVSLAHKSVQQRCLSSANCSNHNQQVAWAEFEAHLG